MTSTVIWRSPAIRLVMEEAGHAARSDAKVLLTGESGVGKEVIARFIHEHSARRSAPCVVINCAGVPDSLLESELFGHERGSFTGAYRDKPGLLETAHGGTVFLDEIGEMSPRMQGLLLRFLETGELQRVGSAAPNRRVDVRLIAATNRRLLERVAEGAFREDLYYRIHVIHIAIPPLRDRREDILPLMEHFLSAFATRAGLPSPAIDETTRGALEDYRWPGNVRELRNLAERLVVNGRRVVTTADLLAADGIKPAAPLKMQLRRTVADAVGDRIFREGESFWTAAYPAFMSHDITREDLRALVTRGLREAQGNYRTLLELLNMNPADQRRFVAFLRKHDCYVALHGDRSSLQEPSITRPLRFPVSA